MRSRTRVVNTTTHRDGNMKACFENIIIILLTWMDFLLVYLCVYNRVLQTKTRAAETEHAGGVDENVGAASVECDARMLFRKHIDDHHPLPACDESIQTRVQSSVPRGKMLHQVLVDGQVWLQTTDSMYGLRAKYDGEVLACLAARGVTKANVLAAKMALKEIEEDMVEESMNAD